MKQVMVEKQNERLNAKGKASTACPDAKSNPKRKASGGSGDQVPKKVCNEKFCQHCKAHGAPTRCTIPVTAVAMTRMVSPLGWPQVSPLSPAGKPSESKKPFNKSGGNKSMAFMQTMLQAYAKTKKASKSKKRKKHKYVSSSSSNSE
jgi:hypothetical protein